MDTYRHIANEISLLKSFDKVHEIKNLIKTNDFSDKEKEKLHNHLNYHIEYLIKSAHKRVEEDYLADNINTEDYVTLPRANKYKSYRLYVDGELYSVGDKFNLELMKNK